MPYTKEQIKKYLVILHNYTKPPEEEVSRKSKCWNCQRDDCFTIWKGYKLCENCCVTNGHVLRYYDKKERKERKYHYEKKVEQICKKLQMPDDEKYEVYIKLMAIDKNIMEILNKQFCRKRMISIFYVIKKILEEMGNEKYKLVHPNISKQTLAYYEKWWNSYKSIKSLK